MTKDAVIEAFWNDYLTSLPKRADTPSKTYTAWHFCETREAADELAELVRQGVKIATCSLLWEYEAEGEDIPKPGDVSIITNWEGEPVCIIRTTQAHVTPFAQVDAQFAYDEGEGDRSLKYWRRVHWDVFSKSCAALGRAATQTMPLVCERFQLIFPLT